MYPFDSEPQCFSTGSPHVTSNSTMETHQSYGTVSTTVNWGSDCPVQCLTGFTGTDGTSTPTRVTGLWWESQSRSGTWRQDPRGSVRTQRVPESVLDSGKRWDRRSDVGCSVSPLSEVDGEQYHEFYSRELHGSRVLDGPWSVGNERTGET